MLPSLQTNGTGNMKIAASNLVLFCLFFALPLFASSHEEETLTPLLLAVQDAPVPFTGSDGRTHLVYELGLSNFSSAPIAIEKLEILGDGRTLETLDTSAVTERLQPAGSREPAESLAASTRANLFLHLVLAPGTKVPAELSHRLALRVSAAPPGHQELSETGGNVVVDRQPVAVISPPLRGEGYISADSCCENTRHARATLPVNGRMWLAQRYAVDWEQVNDSGAIYSGPRDKLESYTIFGQPALAVADAVVVQVIDGLPEQTPGAYPTNLPLAEADGNSVILDLGNRRYALYAHF